jgi:chromosome segregation ATPase
MEDTLTGYNQELLQKQQQLQLLERSLETATLQLQGLVDDNSKLEAELDSTSTRLKELEDKLLRTQEALTDKIKELEEIKNHG